MQPQPPSVHHIALVVSDLQRAEKFYGQVLGLPVMRRWPTPDGTSERSIWFELGKGRFLAVELHPTPIATAAPAVAELGWHLVALSILGEEREIWRERLRVAGHPVTHETPHTLYFRDPEGHRIALSHWPSTPDCCDDTSKA